MSDCIITYTGKKFYPLKPNPKDVDIKDIAHALSQICRFNGHTKSFYSVAEHSVRVSWLLEQEEILHGLLHDASEAYLCDFVRPLKTTPEFSNYRNVEERVQKAIFEHFNIKYPYSDRVTEADDIMLATEIRDLMPQSDEWQDLLSPNNLKIDPVSPIMAERIFAFHFFLYSYKKA